MTSGSDPGMGIKIETKESLQFGQPASVKFFQLIDKIIKPAIIKNYVGQYGQYESMRLRWTCQSMS